MIMQEERQVICVRCDLRVTGKRLKKKMMFEHRIERGEDANSEAAWKETVTDLREQ